MDNSASETEIFNLVLDTAKLMDEHRGEDIIILDVRNDCSFTDFFIITTARSSRHSQSLSANVRDFLHVRNVSVLNNYRRNDESGWLLIDCGSFIIHVMEQAERNFYELEKLWFRSRVIIHSSKSS